MPDESTVPLRLTASLVVYNSDLALLEQTLASLAAAAQRLGNPVTLRLVDNASATAYVSRLQPLVRAAGAAESLSIELIASPRNLGYGGGHNLGMADVGDIHLVLNPDVCLAPEALAEGVERLRRDADTVLLSPFATGGDGEREYLCKRHPSVLVLLLRAFAPTLGWRLWPQRMASYQMSDSCDEQQEVDAPLVSGCFMLIRGSALRQVGGFDRRYFLYFEDFDLSRRLAACGRLVYFPRMRIVHHGGYAARKGVRHLSLFVRNGVRFFNQYGWRWF